MQEIILLLDKNIHWVNIRSFMFLFGLEEGVEFIDVSNFSLSRFPVLSTKNYKLLSK